MLRKTRIILALIFFTAITLLFLDFTGTIHHWLGWMAKIQFMPALLALNLGVVASLLILTLLVGRVYCSVICPLGVMQDIITWINSRRKRKNKYRFGYTKEHVWLRYILLALFAIAIIAGIGSFVALLAPYSSYGRIASNLFSPIYKWGNNLLAYFAERADSYAFYTTDVWLRSLPTFIIAAVTFIVLAVLAWRSGRTYCNAICPVGTLLGSLSRFSLFAPIINTSKCIDCGICGKSCKASCIDTKNHRIDYSRCVACMDCLDNCTHDAIHLGSRLKHHTEKESSSADTKSREADMSRRTFLSIAGTVAAVGAANAQKKVDGGLAAIEEKKVPERRTPIVPAGAKGVKHFYRHCTGCQLCVSECPNEVLRPSSDITRLMQPEMSYERGYCRPECTRCSWVCPAGAILPVTREEKSSIQIGHAVWIMANCIPVVDGVECGNCARHCPTGAIHMVPSNPDDENSVKTPIVNTARCIGCGACENLCPARPFSAIVVEGNSVHNEY